MAERSDPLGLLTKGAVVTATRGWRVAVVVLAFFSLTALGFAIYTYAHQPTAIADYVRSHRTELRGPPGQTGATGKQGPQGVPGQTGAAGAAATSGTTPLTHQECTYNTPPPPLPPYTDCHTYPGP
jgi:hypothetical protein